MNSRTAILAAANPIDSKYNPKLSVVQNIKLPPTLLSRFDLIYLMLDKQNETMDRRLANHIVSLYSSNSELQVDHNIQEDREFLFKYISYARNEIHPAMSAEAQQALIESYAELRRQGNAHKTITATPRQLVSMIRLSESMAKMQLRSVVTRRDVEEALRLIKVAT